MHFSNRCNRPSVIIISLDLDFQIELWALFETSICWKTSGKVYFKLLVCLFVKEVWIQKFIFVLNEIYTESSCMQLY